ncbi:LPS export ABC transporter periplasmic protein LptC [Aerosakkonemataceae cyanobacterium BLCC-F46]|uniref:LPS export ABC transporter periplasmic protein LptC n=2 Tax=Floridanema TaxID=3396149 RepID=A0ABV4XDI7_9CYAN
MMSLRKITLNKLIFLKLILIGLLFGMVACDSEGRTARKLAEDSRLAQERALAKESDSNLTLNDVILDKVDDSGRTLWKIKAKQAVYSNDKKDAKILSPIGDLFQDGKLVYQVSGQTGEIKEDGKQMFLKGQIVATDIQNGVVLRGNELEWRPEEDILIVRNQLTGTHKQVQASAQEARAFSRAKKIEFIGQVVAKAIDPPLIMKTEKLFWQVQEQKMFSDRFTQIDRYNGQKITDRATGNQGEVDLKNKIAKLGKNGQVTFDEPPMQIASNAIVWNLNTKIVSSNQPVTIYQREQQITLNASQGRVELTPQIAYLIGGVQGTGQKPPSNLRTDEMTWYLETQQFAANGNVFYQQTDPPLTLNGPKAFGNLKEQKIAITGNGNNSPVITEIVPQGRGAGRQGR